MSAIYERAKRQKNPAARSRSCYKPIELLKVIVAYVARTVVEAALTSAKRKVACTIRFQLRSPGDVAKFLF